MKTNHRNITARTSSLFLLAAFAGLVLLTDVAAQPGAVRRPASKATRTTTKGAPAIEEHVNWYVSYTVTIKGNGEVKGELQGEADIKWWVDRSFVGRMRLGGPAPVRSGNKIETGWEGYENYGPKARPWTVDVKIKDRLEKFLEGPGEIATHENRTDVTVWEGDPTLQGPAEDYSILAVKVKTQTYFVNLNVFPHSLEKNIRMSRFTIFDRSPVGYGGKPTREVTKPLEDQIRLSEIPMPYGDHLVPLKKGLVISSSKSKYAEDSKLPPTYPYTIEFSKTCFPPREPFFEGIADTKTKVEICVEFLLSKAPH